MLEGKTANNIVDRYHRIITGDQNQIELGIIPEGKISITENGMDIDVAQYAKADVNVPASAVVSGTKNITANGNDIDVTNYAAVNVNVQPLTAYVKVESYVKKYNSDTGTYDEAPWTFTYQAIDGTEKSVTVQYGSFAEIQVSAEKQGTDYTYFYHIKTDQIASYTVTEKYYGYNSYSSLGGSPQIAQNSQCVLFWLKTVFAQYPGPTRQHTLRFTSGS